MAQSYTASDIEVLTGLEPVRRRRACTRTPASPNHLAQEVIDNCVDEAIAGHCEHIGVTLHKDGSVSVEDDGRGMPVDIHPKEKVSGVEVILTRLHAGAKFSTRTTSAPAACTASACPWSTRCRSSSSARSAATARNGTSAFATARSLEAQGRRQRQARQSGTTVRFWPDPAFFDSANISVPRLKHVLRAKAVLCPGLRMRFTVEASGETEEWYFTGDLGAYLLEQLGKRRDACPRSRTSATSRAATRGGLGPVLGAGRRRRRSPRAT